MTNEITYSTSGDLKINELLDLFEHSGYFPFKDKNDTERLREMFDNANLVVSAWHRGKIIGISRALTDFCYCCYLSDLAVRDDYKGSGIGKKLVELTKEKAGERCKLILHSNADAEGFYQKIGMKKINSAYAIQRDF
ncbi:GNAT family N-acetyltransferase [Sinomicrobium weinanense]|uniref:GNAT family N-acetyltransferase n=1 Tax=Sinomicrobium weinanense TaxID=2842200 RepID=A0A926Q2Y7_9FLAO|nr:GNAT family N-acetyltransferase [Sinomicrobium weinanense]MBC9796329.1 GNAT family N-acetyltransferase [Sinomicrobium weinanense]MBU3122469.1 GNAT family N-acetyltransferase [Sinomicrobium weinanense]